MAVKIEPQYGPAAIDAYLESEAAATKFTLSLSAAKSKLWSSAEAAAERHGPAKPPHPGRKG
jgi:hypothetical protein